MYGPGLKAEVDSSQEGFVVCACAAPPIRSYYVIEK